MSKTVKQEQAGEVQVKTIVKKRGGVGAFFCGFFFCLFFIIVSVVGLGIWCYYNVTLSSVERLLGVEIPLDGEYKNLALKDLIAEGLEYRDISLAGLQEIGVELPEAIPGTEIQLTPLYTSEIDFQGEHKAVNQFRIIDIANGLDEFIKAILPVVYSYTTVQQVLNSAQVTLPEDLNYPALTDKYYNIGTAENPIKVSLGELTIEQAFDVLPAHYSSENLTVQEAVNAFGLDILDIPAGETDVYAGLRNLVITEITTDSLLKSVDGALLNSLFDLSDFDFTQSETFNSTKLADMLDYIQTVPLGEIVNIPEITDSSTATDRLLNAVKNVTYSDLTSEDMITAISTKIDAVDPEFTLDKIIDFSEMSNLDFLASVRLTDLLRDASTTINNTLADVYIGNFVTLESVVSETFFTDNTEFRSIAPDTALSKLRDSISNLTIAEILTADQLATLDLTPDEQALTLNGLLVNRQGSTLAEILGVYANESGYLNALSTATADTFATTLANAEVIDLIGSENNPSTVARLADMNLREIAESEDLISMLTESFGTLGDLLGVEEGSDGILGIIAGVTFDDLLGQNAADAVMDALKSSTMTLAQMLDGAQFDNPLINSIMQIQVGALFGDDPQQAFIDALSSEGNTIGSLFGISDDTGIMSYIAGVKMGDLLGGNAADAIMSALTMKDGEYVTLGDFLNSTEDTGIMSAIQNVTMFDLLGQNPDVTAGEAISNAIKDSGKNLGDILGINDATGIVGYIADIGLDALFGGGDAATDALNGIVNNIKLVDVFTDVATLPENNILRIIYEGNHDILVKDLANEITNIKIADVVGEQSGIFLLIEESSYNSVTLGNLNDLAFKQNLSLQDLCDAEVINETDLEGIENPDQITIQMLIEAYKFYIKAQQSSGTV